MRILLVLALLLPAIDADAQIFKRRSARRAPAAPQSPACPGGICPNPYLQTPQSPGNVRINYKGGFDVPPPQSALTQSTLWPQLQQPAATVVETPSTSVVVGPQLVAPTPAPAPAPTEPSIVVKRSVVAEAEAAQLQLGRDSDALVEALRLNLAAVSAAIDQLAEQKKQESEAVRGAPSRLVKELPIVRLTVEKRDGTDDQEAVIDLSALTAELLTQ